MDRVSTAYAFQNGAADFLRAQAKQTEAGRQISDSKRAVDLKGFGRQSETLIAAKTIQARATSFVEMHKLLGGRLESQSLALETVAQTADTAAQRMLSAVSAGRADSLMTILETTFGQAVDALNWQHEGRYLFAGSQVGQQPISISTLADLAAAPAASDAFNNDQTRLESRLNETTTVPSSFLADEVGTELFEVFRSIQLYHQTTPLTGVLTNAQTDFLKAKIGEMQNMHEKLLGRTAENGFLQQRVEEVSNAQARRATSLQFFIADISEVDLAEASANLVKAELAVQASAAALKALKDNSILNFLPV
jgi:flagellar hook-associated protein 3 FlgL